MTLLEENENEYILFAKGHHTHQVIILSEPNSFLERK